MASPSGRFLGVGGAGVPSSPRARSGVIAAAKGPNFDADALKFVKPEDFSLVQQDGPMGEVYGQFTTPENFFRDALMGDEMDGVKARMIERNQPGQGALLPQVGHGGMGPAFEREVSHFVGPDISRPEPIGTSPAWYAPPGNIFTNTQAGDSYVHEFLHSLLHPQGAADVAGASFNWRRPRRLGDPAADDMDMPIEARADREPLDVQYARKNGLSRRNAWRNDDIQSAIYNRDPVEMNARLAELKWVKALEEGGFPETRAQNSALLQRLLDEPTRGGDPVMQIGPLKGQQYPGFRDQQRALQYNWKVLRPSGQSQIEDLFFRLGSNDKPEAGRA